MLLNIITPCSRPENLEPLYSSIMNDKPSGVDVRWIVVFDAVQLPEGPKPEEAVWLSFPSYKDGQKVSVAGHGQRNFALEKVKDGWVYFLDDDTLMHPNLLNRFAAHARPGVSLAFHQQTAAGRMRLPAGPTSLTVCRVDTGQVLLERSLIGDRRWHPLSYCADGIFIESCHKANPSAFQFLDEPLSIYNALRP